MASTAVRHTSSLTVPSTQNTAPVLDFRCLFTHDLRRKAKRWQDGLLRFHTFNKRVMVYDEPRNFVGDTHWREDSAIQDGDELRLDKGVLIQVGEANGSTEQDLTGIIAKRGKVCERSPEQTGFFESNSTRSTGASNSASMVAEPTELRPKTLNSLLGTPRGPLGRATLPTKSPCDLRKQSENSYSTAARPAKRQRVEAPSERTHEASLILPSRGTVSPNFPSGYQTDNQAKKRTKQAALVRKSPLVMPEKTRLLEMKKRNRETINSRRPQGQDDQSQTMTEIDKQPTRRLSKPARLEQALKPSNGQRSEPIDEVTSGEEILAPQARRSMYDPTLSTHLSSSGFTDVGSSHPQKPLAEVTFRDTAKQSSSNKRPVGQVKLQMASRKPRKKLMYRDFLPHDIPNDRLEGSVSDTIRGASSKGKFHVANRDFHQEQRDRLQARLARKAMDLNDDSPRNALDIGPESQSLFLSQDEFDIPSTNPNVCDEPPDPFKLDEPKRPLALSTAGTELTCMDQILRRSPKSSPTRKPYSSPPIPPSRPSPPARPEPSTTKPSAPSMKPFQPHTKPSKPSIVPLLPERHQSPRSRTLQRSLSSSIAACYPQNPRSPLRKTVSDTVSLHPPPQAKEPDMKEASPDPWSREAFDLFGVGRPGG